MRRFLEGDKLVDDVAEDKWEEEASLQQRGIGETNKSMTRRKTSRKGCYTTKCSGRTLSNDCAGG